MKRATRKYGLCLVPAMALAALFTACGEDGSSGVDSVPVEPGESSSSSVVSGAAPDVTPDPVPGSNSSSSSEGESSSSSVTPGTESSDSSESDESSSPSVTPDPVPGSNSSSGEEDVKSDGFYSNSSKCPAGLDCKYASTTEYLNSTKTYGEILDTRDGQVYKTIKICDDKNENCQTWMAQNVNYVPTNVSSMDKYAWSGCYGEGSEGLTEEQVAANCSKYGRLYTWEVAMNKTGCGYESYCNNSNEGSQGVCPHGWRLPTKEDWQKLVKPMAANVDDFTTYWYYNGAGVELKSVDGWHENSSSMVGTNASGFSAIPGGIRDHYGDFNDIGNYAHFWSASEINSNEAYTMFLFSERGEANLLNYTKFYAFSVRCLKDL